MALFPPIVCILIGFYVNNKQKINEKQKKKIVDHTIYHLMVSIVLISQFYTQNV